MTHILDTDVVIDILAGRQATIHAVDALHVEIAISVVTIGEYYEGIYGNAQPQDAEQKFAKLLTRFRTYEVTLAIMKRWASIRRALRNSGMLITDLDIVIAATAIEYDLTLITRNLDHFERIDGLKLYDWGESHS